MDLPGARRSIRRGTEGRTGALSQKSHGFSCSQSFEKSLLPSIRPIRIDALIPRHTSKLLNIGHLLQLLEEATYSQICRESMTKEEEIVSLLSKPGSLFLLTTLPELRKQGLTYLAFYTLQRAANERPFTQYALRRETGLPDYETSRACTLLARADLIRIAKSNADRRMRILTATARGRKVLDKIIQTAAERLKDGIPPSGRIRRLEIVASLFKRATERLHGQFQLSFFDPDLVNDAPPRRRKKRG